MKAYDASQIFNVGLFGHGGVGKTSLVEAALFRSGAISRLGSVGEGNSTTDYDPDEVRRGMSVSLALAPLEWHDRKINLVDCPGYADFFGEVLEGVRIVDGAVIVVDAVSGVQVGTDQVWKELDKPRVPRLIFCNKMERENADFERVLGQLRDRYGKAVVPIVAPVGREQGFRGVADLVRQCAYIDSTDGSEPVPDNAAETVERLREQLIEAVCELDDELINKYLEGEEISTDELSQGLAHGVRDGQLVPVLCGSALGLKGVEPLLNAIVAYLPSAAEAKDRLEADGVPTPESNGKLAALVFKTISDPFIGKLNFVRVYSGTISADSHIWNARKNRDERVGQLFMMRGKNQETEAKIGTGDIGVIPKLQETTTGDTLTVKDGAVLLRPITFPDPSYSSSIQPKSKADVDKLSTALGRMLEEDPTLHVARDVSTGEQILSGLGESHIDIFVERMQRKFGVAVEIGTPKVAYRETISSAARAEGRHVRQSGGHGQYGVVWLEVEPMERGGQFEFVDKIVGGVVPRQFIPAVEKGIREALDSGIIGGFPVVDVRVSLVDGKYHPVDSSEQAFKTAGSIGFKTVMQKAHPVLLEPVMDVAVTVPDEFTGDVIGDLNTRRARVQGMNPDNGFTEVLALVPQAEMLRYSTELRSITGGRGSYSMRFSHYEEVPAHLQQQIVE
ncbi:MAG: elongation factor G, partial [Chloroflexi bacterium]|nr:elongation factor G [Chloroflexota bacterium]